MCLHVSRVISLSRDMRFYKVFTLRDNGELYTPFKQEHVKEKVLYSDNKFNVKLFFNHRIVEGGAIHAYENLTDATYVAWRFYGSLYKVVICEITPLGEIALAGTHDVAMSGCIIEKLVWCSFGNAEDYELVWEK